MNLYALSPLPMENARFHADVHLRPAITTTMKIISDTFHHAHGKGIIKVNAIQKKADLTYWIDGQQLLPPNRNPSVWSKWAALNRVNLWWLVDLSFQLNLELRNRLGGGDQADCMKIQQWAISGIIGAFIPLPSKERFLDGLRDEFPLCVPFSEILKLGDDVIKKSVVDIYKAHYASRKGYVRMKWTKRERPSFMIADGDEPNEDPVSTTEQIPF